MVGRTANLLPKGAEPTGSLRTFDLRPRTLADHA